MELEILTPARKKAKRTCPFGVTLARPSDRRRNRDQSVTASQSATNHFKRQSAFPPNNEHILDLMEVFTIGGNLIAYSAKERTKSRKMP